MCSRQAVYGALVDIGGLAAAEAGVALGAVGTG